MDSSTPGLPVHHQLPEFAQTHVHWVGDAIQPYHPLLSPFSSHFQSFPASGSFQISQFFRWPKYWSLSLSVSPSSEYSGLISFRMDWLDLLAVQGALKSFLQHHSSKPSVLQRSAFFIVQLSHPYMTTGKTIALTRWTFDDSTAQKEKTFPHLAWQKLCQWKATIFPNFSSFNGLFTIYLSVSFSPLQKSSISAVWNLNVYLTMVLLCSVAQSCRTLCDPMDWNPPGSSVLGDSPGKKARVDCHVLLQGNLPKPGLKPRSPAQQADSLLTEPGGKSIPKFQYFLDPK